MKKSLFIIFIIVVIVSIFVSCSINSSNKEISTTAVTDKQGATHYYETVSNETNKSVYAEIVTDNKGKAVTNKNDTYVTKEYTTIMLTDIIADNTVEFEPDETTNKNANTTDGASPSPTKKETTATTTETTTQKETQPATDKDGWITKWY